MKKSYILLIIPIFLNTLSDRCHAEGENIYPSYQCNVDSGKKPTISWPSNFNLDYDVVALNPNEKDENTNSESSKMLIGLKYKLSGDLFGHRKCRANLAGGAELDKTVFKNALDDLNGLYGDFLSQGTLASNKDENPDKFLESQVRVGYAINGTIKTNNPSIPDNFINYSGGAFGKYEASQGGDNEQSVFGGYLQVYSTFGYAANNSVFANVNVGRVDAAKDPERKAVAPDDTKYDRADAQIIILKSIGLGKLKDFQFSYRYFKEIGASDIIKNAGLDRTHYAEYRLDFDAGFYAAYAAGSLPFDKQSDGVAKIGWSTNLDINFLK